jgi:ketosteroid isomerase-like protein
MKLTTPAVLVVALLVITPPLCRAAAADSAQPKKADEQALINIEYQWANAYVSGDAEKLASILSRDYVQTNTRARVTDKAEEVSDLRIGTFRYEKFETTQLKVHLYGDAAVVTGLIAAKGTDTAFGKTIQGHMRMTDTFIRQDGRWQVVASQTTLVPESPPEQTPGG